MWYAFYLFATGDRRAASALAAPTNLTAEVGWNHAGTVQRLTLTWGAVVGATSYIVEFSANSGADWADTELNPVTNSATVLEDWFVLNDTTWRYRVRATDGVDTSDPSNVAGAALFTESDTFTFPVGATSRSVVCVGAGGNGNSSGTGGGGGALSIASLANTEIGYTFDIGPSAEEVGTQFYETELPSTVRCYAECGYSDGSSGQASNGDGDTKFSGGNGGTPDAAAGGGGGAAGKTGNGGNGGNASGTTPGNGGVPGTGGTLSGTGGIGGSSGDPSTGGNGTAFGAGGGGATGGIPTPGPGSGGCVAITWTQAS